MTRDHRRKKAVRAHAAATGRTYTDAATALRGATSATELRDALVAELEAGGWPLEIEHIPQGHALVVYAGPASVHVGRAAEPLRSETGEEHPDDPAVFDQDSPLTVTLWAPLTTAYAERAGRVLGVDAHKIPGDRPAAEIVAEIDRVVRQARRRDLLDLSADAECGICGDAYPGEGLFEPTRAGVSVCPCCAFDGDLLGPHPARLAFKIDLGASETLALPAGWAGVQALLCCLGGPDLQPWLHEQWRAAGSFFLPGHQWADHGQSWMWLPPQDQRPAALADLGCGASLGRVVAALDRAHPDLRTQCRARREQEVQEFIEEYYGSDADPGDPDVESSRTRLRAADGLLDRFWPAAVAYTVSMLTQQAERPDRRAPWHVLESFELPDWVDTMNPTLDHFHIESVLRSGILTIRDVLDPPGQD